MITQTPPIDPRPRLTARQEEVLEIIKKFISKHGVSPTFRELSLLIGVVGTNGAMSHVKPLRKKGYLDWVPHHARSFRILGKHQCPYCDGTGSMDGGVRGSVIL